MAVTAIRGAVAATAVAAVEAGAAAVLEAVIPGQARTTMIPVTAEIPAIIAGIIRRSGS